MTLRHLKIFVAVCEYGSTTKASKALYIVQPTISHTITELEKYYKISLFERVNQRLVLTEIGTNLYKKAKEILAGYEEFEALAISSSENPRVRIGASLTLGQTLIPRFLEIIEKNKYNISPQVLIRQSTRIEQELEESNLDFGVISGNYSSPHLKGIPISHEKFVAICHVDYPISSTLTFKELSEQPLLIREHGSSSRDFLEKLALERNITLSPKIDSSNNQAIVTAIKSSVGIGFLPENYVREYIDTGVFREIEVSDIVANQTNYLVIHKNKRLNPLQQQAFDVIKNLQ
ncbi:MAG: LysR family transcriptional regulator [Clostridia bacterium]|nr:LysR family transcriptional regulator [Clostridia bacterium]